MPLIDNDKSVVAGENGENKLNTTKSTSKFYSLRVRKEPEVIELSSDEDNITGEHSTEHSQTKQISKTNNHNGHNSVDNSGSNSSNNNKVKEEIDTRDGYCYEPWKLLYKDTILSSHLIKIIKEDISQPFECPISVDFVRFGTLEFKSCSVVFATCKGLTITFKGCFFILKACVKAAHANNKFVFALL